MDWEIDLLLEVPSITYGEQIAGMDCLFVVTVDDHIEVGCWFFFPFVVVVQLGFEELRFF